jgi:hypothetical protein
VTVEVAGRDGLVDRERVTSNNSSHFHPIEEDARTDCAYVSIPDRVLN